MIFGWLALLVGIAGCGESHVPQHLDRKLVELAPGVSAEFVYINAPSVAPNGFMMGSPASEVGRFDDETQFRAVITKGYWLQTTEVTQAQWEAVVGTHPAEFQDRHSLPGGHQFPIENVSWNDCQTFIERLRARGIPARLPTEAEWEFACRAGTTTTYSFGNDEEQLGSYTWFRDNSGRELIDVSNDKDSSRERLLANGCRTHAVATKRPNAWGLYDMHGNVWEWCQDWYGSYPMGRSVDPSGLMIGELRILRGGGWIDTPQFLRSAIRIGIPPSYPNSLYGLRLVLDSEYPLGPARSQTSAALIRPDERAPRWNPFPLPRCGRLTAARKLR